MTHYETMLEKIRAVLEGRITADVESYKINGREITKIPFVELQTMERQYAALVQQEKAADAVNAGLGNPNTIRIKF